MPDGSQYARDAFSKAEDVEWPEPDREVLQEGRRPPPPLPLDLFGPDWERWLIGAAEGAGAPVDYVALGLLAIAAAALGNARRVSPWSGWEEPSILWACLVGDPSSGKSPALDPVRAAVRTIEKEMAGDFEGTLRKHEAAKLSARFTRERWESEVKEASKKGFPPPEMPSDATEPEEPIRPRVIVTDSTIEQLGILAAAHEKGLLYFRDELAGWFGAFDRYGGSGADRAIWLEAYGGRFYSIDRVKRPKPIRIEHFSVGVLGGVQPERLCDLLDGADDGLAARFLWTWPEKLAPFIPKQRPDPDFATDSLRRLIGLPLVADGEDTRPFICGLTPDALAAFSAWREREHEAEGSCAGLLKSAAGKAPGHILRCALVLEHLWWSSRPRINLPPATVSEKAIAAAIRFVDEYQKPMTARVFGDASLPAAQRNAATLARWIEREKPITVNGRHLLNTVKLPGLRKAEEVYPAIEELCEAGWLLPAPSRKGPTAGRPRADFNVNPKLWRLKDAA